MDTVKIGGIKYNLKDLDPKLREKIEEQLRKDKEFEDDHKKLKILNLRTKDKKDDKIGTDNKDGTSILRKMFGRKSGIFEK